MRLFPSLGDILVRDNGGNAIYNSLHSVAERKFLQGLSYQIVDKTAFVVTGDTSNHGQPDIAVGRFGMRA